MGAPEGGQGQGWVLGLAHRASLPATGGTCSPSPSSDAVPGPCQDPHPFPLASPGLKLRLSCLLSRTQMGAPAPPWAASLPLQPQGCCSCVRIAPDLAYFLLILALSQVPVGQEPGEAPGPPVSWRGLERRGLGRLFQVLLQRQTGLSRAWPWVPGECPHTRRNLPVSQSSSEAARLNGRDRTHLLGQRMDVGPGFKMA